MLRDGKDSAIDVTQLVPGDVVRIGVGDVVPADVLLLTANGLECDESVLTGESVPAEKSAELVASPESALNLPSCGFMGTVVRAGNGVGVVVETAEAAIPPAAPTRLPLELRVQRRALRFIAHHPIRTSPEPRESMLRSTCRRGVTAEDRRVTVARCGGRSPSGVCCGCMHPRGETDEAQARRRLPARPSELPSSHSWTTLIA